MKSLTTSNYQYNHSTLIIDSKGRIETLERNAQPWKVTLVQTGINTQTGGRIKKIKKF